MILFPSAQEAFEICYQLLEEWREGKAFDPNPNLFRGGTGGLGSIVVALDVERMWKDACNGECRSYSPVCFRDWFVPDPVVRPERRSWDERRRIEVCVAIFEGKLRNVGWIP